MDKKRIAALAMAAGITFSLPVVAHAESNTKNPYDEAKAIYYEGAYGNGEERKKNLEAAGYDYYEVQRIIDTLYYGKGQTNTQPPVVGPLDPRIEAAVDDIWFYGKYGNGETRKKNLEAEGLDYNTVQKRLYEKYVLPMQQSQIPQYNPNYNACFNEIVNRTIRGDFGNGEERKANIEALGYNYEAVQNAVNQILGYPRRFK